MFLSKTVKSEFLLNSHFYTCWMTLQMLFFILPFPFHVRLDEYLAQDKRWTNQLFLLQGSSAVVKSVDIWAFQKTSADLYGFHCARQPVSIKGCKRPCQFGRDNSTKTPFFSVVTRIMLFTGVLPKPSNSPSMWCYWLQW